jgi:type IV pilus assembly protein PilM
MAKPTPAKKPTTVTGIEYGDHAVRVATVSVRSGRTVVRSLSQAKVKTRRGGVKEEHRAAKIEALKEALANHSKDLGTVIVGIPREEVVSRTISLPSTEEAEVREMLFYDAERYLPFPAEEAEISYRILQQIGETESRIHVVGAKRSDLHKILEDLDAAGVQPERIDVDVHGCAYGSSRNGMADSEPYAVLHLDEMDSSVALVVDGQIRFSRSLPVGARAVKGLERPIDLARDPVSMPEEERSWWIGLERDLKRSLMVFAHDEFGVPAKRLFLCGPGSLLEGISAGLERATGLPVAVPSEVDASRVEEPVEDYATSIGLALEEAEEDHHINLIPEEVYEHYEAARRKRFLANSAMLLIINVGLLAGLAGHAVWDKTQTSRIIDLHIAKIQPHIRDIEKIAEQLKVIDENVDRENTAFRVMKELFEITPERVRIGQLTFAKSDSVEMDFETFELRDWNEYQNILSRSEYFQGSIKEGNATTKPYDPRRWKFPQTLNVNGLKVFLRSNSKEKS